MAGTLLVDPDGVARSLLAIADQIGVTKAQPVTPVVLAGRGMGALANDQRCHHGSWAAAESDPIPLGPR